MNGGEIFGVCRGPGLEAESCWHGWGPAWGLCGLSTERETGHERWGRRLAGHPGQQWARTAFALVCLTGLNIFLDNNFNGISFIHHTTHSFKVYHSVVFRIVPELCIHQLSQF